MNQKTKFRTTTTNPEYIYQVDVDVEVRGKLRTYRLKPGTRMTVHYLNPNRPALHKGTYTFCYAEQADDTLIIYADWRGMRKSLREADLKTVL